MELKDHGRSFLSGDFFIAYSFINEQRPRTYDMDMHSKENNLEHEIEQLEQQRMKDLNLAMHSYYRVTKVAGYSAFIVFIVMSFSMHSALLASETNVAAHFLALVINLALAFITYKLVGEFHPLRRRGAEHWNASRKTKFQINRLKHNT